MPCLNARVVYGWAQEAPPPDYSALFDAARAGNTDPILDHLQSEEGGDLSRVVDGAGNTLLHWAVLVAKPTLVSTLIDQGVDKNALNDQGEKQSACPSTNHAPLRVTYKLELTRARPRCDGTFLRRDDR